MNFNSLYVLFQKIDVLSILLIFFAALCSSRIFFFFPHGGCADNEKLISRLVAAGGRWSSRRCDFAVTSLQVPDGVSSASANKKRVVIEALGN